MNRQVFFDPSGIRWKYLRRIFTGLTLFAVALLIAFACRVLRTPELSQLTLPSEHRTAHALNGTELPHAAFGQGGRPAIVLSQTDLASPSAEAQPLPVSLHASKGIRAAFYAPWDAASYESLRDAVHELDLIFPEWLHVLQADGSVHALSAEDLTEETGPIKVKDDLTPLLVKERTQAVLAPEVNNFDELQQKWIPAVGQFFGDAGARARFRHEVADFVINGRYTGLMINFEGFDVSAMPGYHDLIEEVAQDLHARGLKLYVSAPANDPDYPYAYVAAQSDGIVLMDYGQHSPDSQPGSVAGQEWFRQNLQQALTLVPRQKLICGIANYGYDWSFQEQIRDGELDVTPLGARRVSAQDAWQDAHDSGASIEVDPQELNPHLALIDEPNELHEIWYTDAATAMNQMRTAQRLGVNNFAIWRLGTEDRSLWAVWEHPESVGVLARLQSVPPGHEVDYRGMGEVLTLSGAPAYGWRTLAVDPQNGLVSGEQFQQFPSSYQAEQHGVSYDDEVALTFDDGPDAQWTPQILDILKAKQVPATFFLVGSVASKHPWLMKRIVREGHEIGNHTWSHPDISKISPQELRRELNLTENLFAAELGVRPLLFRPPYSIDAEPEVDNQVPPIEVAQGMGYVTVGNKVDPEDWTADPKHSAQEIVAGVLGQASRGNIILLHDGGGNRRETVRALPAIIQELRDRGYSFVPVSHLLGKSRAEVMPAVPHNERWVTLFDRFGFSMYTTLYYGIVLILVAGTALTIARLLSLAGLATFSRFWRGRNYAAPTFKPAVAVLIPAYNEEKVIVRTVRSVLNSDYPELRVIVIDDASTDDTFEVAHEAFIQEPRVTVLSAPKGGKAQALTYGLEQVWEEIFVGIDADTCPEPEAISRLVRHFSDPNVAAVAGNTKVANQVNLWTRWQALEYITSQNFERRALDVFGIVTVVPGAIGAWRTAAVRQAGGYPAETVAEDADLTMALLSRGYRVNYEDCALAYTEVPSNARSLTRQRFRWSFGILQAVWKHRALLRRKGPMAWVALPNIVIFHFLLPLISPFVDLLFGFGVVTYFVARHSRFEGQIRTLIGLLAAFLVFMLTDFVASAVALVLERLGADWRENLRLLSYVWLQRFVCRQLFSFVIVKALKRALQGGFFEWGKLERTAALQCNIAKECKLVEEVVVAPYHPKEDSAESLKGAL